MNNITLDTVTNNSSNLEKEEKKKMENKYELSGTVIDKNISNNVGVIEIEDNSKNKGNSKMNKNELFNFEADHNGVKCIESLKEEDKGTERQYWFTVKMLTEIFDENRKTIENNVKSLCDDGEFSSVKCYHTEKVPASDGKFYSTSLYNLEVLNKLGMCCFRGNKKAKEIRNKFNDVLVKHETNQDNHNLPRTYLDALKALVASEEAKEKALIALKEKEIENQNLRTENGVLSQDYKSNKDICLEILAENLSDYALSTLKAKVSKIAQKLSHENGYPISEQIVVVEGVERKTPYYHIDISQMIKDMLIEDPKCLKKIK